ncbi:MAG: flagellar biosynthetic protein FliO [Candidatus Thiodiazotropha sp. (ex Lucinoma kastoroae)]|nr:flagellar biosynthetic protein FliO [Candidatus Thiodiazotropha sp. (ex Lucinoma kastoroae)]MCU7860644.1 flagellar biosynthetic protein FliO [Candidatus Thiodiazotropha sp. (ex Lucinoma kastoroae)]
MSRWPLIMLLFSQTLLSAETVEKQVGIKIAPLGTESLLSTAGGLLLVLGLIIGGAWLFKRYGTLPMGGKGLVRVVGGTSIGTREKVVVVEVENTRLLLGVAPGQIRTLHVLQQPHQSFRTQLDREQDKHELPHDEQESR